MFPIWRAIRVLPVPGGPYSKIPLTCWIPIFSIRPGGKILEANALRKIAPNSVSSPPIPISSNLKFGAMMEFAAGRFAEPFSLMGDLASLKKVIAVFLKRIPRTLGLDSVLPPESFSIDMSIECK